MNNMLTHFGVIVTIASGMLVILVTMLGFLVKGVVSFTRLVAKVESIEQSSIALTKTITDAIIDIAVAKNTDEDLEQRIQNLEQTGRRR